MNEKILRKRGGAIHKKTPGPFLYIKINHHTTATGTLVRTIYILAMRRAQINCGWALSLATYTNALTEW